MGNGNGNEGGEEGQKRKGGIAPWLFGEMPLRNVTSAAIYLLLLLTNFTVVVLCSYFTVGTYSRPDITSNVSTSQCGLWTSLSS